MDVVDILWWAIVIGGVSLAYLLIFALCKVAAPRTPEEQLESDNEQLEYLREHSYKSGLNK